MTINIPQKAEQILHILNEAGYEAYVVGGCVRDSILDRVPGDWDITTSALPEQVKELFHRTVDTGIQHGTVTVMMGKEGFEVTTYRVDGEYHDGRHPDAVTFTRSLEEDLKRRDFTINAMAYHPEHGLVDLFGGMEDINRKIIRCVGDPVERFTEDALRIMRAVRFAGQLGFSIEEKTKQAASKLASNLEKISAERIETEIRKLLLSNHPELLRTAYELGITEVVLPEFDAIMQTEQNTPHHFTNVGEHTLKALELIPANKVLRYTMLLHDMGKPKMKTTDENGRDHFKGHGEESERIANEVLHRLKMDNDTIKKVTKLVKWHDVRTQPTPKAVRKAMNKLGEELYPLLLQVQYADTMAQSTYQREEKLERIHKVKVIYEQIIEEKQCFSIRNLAVNGKDLIAIGVTQGKQIGEILNILLEDVIIQKNIYLNWREIKSDRKHDAHVFCLFFGFRFFRILSYTSPQKNCIQ